jgi:DUF2924 family protein
MCRESSNVCVVDVVGHPPQRRATHGLRDPLYYRRSRRSAIKKRRVPSDPLALADELARLSQLDLDELRERWKGMFGKIPSLEIGRSFLIRAIAYRLQELAYGGLKPSTRRLLTEVAEETAAGSAPKAPQIRKAQSGTILVREWQGNAHRVTMLDDGVSFNGKHYRSLSEVAREITGSRWSGPRFFGLRLPAQESNHGTV